MNRYWAVVLISLAALVAMPQAQAQGEVARSIITTEVVDREPVNDLEMVPVSNETVLYFTELRNMEGQTVIHRWIFGNEAIADVSFNVGGPRWRVWSSKKMLPEWVGAWTVQVVNGAGEVVAEKRFTYGMSEDTGTGMASEEPPMDEQPPTTEEAPTTEPPPAMDTMPGGE